ncbi:hypothetical protein PSZ95_24930, partial [Shigella sonnei]|nr:hypothetical protein [Shigella sonnei]
MTFVILSGEIDLSGEDHKGHANGNDPKKGVIGQDIAFLGIIAVGMTFVILSGGIDLS